ncbi:zinc transcription factor [Colletotrichum tofieldiae]|nr:zinc transcription factor [Colletotrichum tofieldiae]GKT96340.1 zinc transcription factor [Colletotrichum tofieldiae]
MDHDDDAKPNMMALDMNANMSAAGSVRSDSLGAFDPVAQQNGPKPPIKRRAPIACRRFVPSDSPLGEP